MSVNKWSMWAAAFGLAAATGGLGGAAPVKAADCAQDTLCRIITSGKLKAGVVVDYKPWGYRGGGGEFLGLEPDMWGEPGSNPSVYYDAGGLVGRIP